ncbi:hypothetical protein OC844_005756 [Tilletia horrida]|nr:hypothetical protein OC844_005756 [Tilletia horrida]
MQEIHDQAILEQEQLQKRQRGRLDRVFASAKHYIDEARGQTAGDMESLISQVDSDVQKLEDRWDGALSMVRDKMKSCTSQAQHEVDTTPWSSDFAVSNDQDLWSRIPMSSGPDGLAINLSPPHYDQVTGSSSMSVLLQQIRQGLSAAPGRMAAPNLTAVQPEPVLSP